MTKRETRRAEIRAADVDGRPGVTLRAITPGVVDDYGTVWAADAFDEALAVRGPVLCWSHRWDEPLGPMVGYRSGPDGPEIDFAFSDFDAVPMARRAHAQVADGTIADCSVGFERREWRDATDEDRKEYGPEVREVMLRAGMDELSLVLRGAVPGAKVLAVRAAGTVDLDAAVELARRVNAGELTQADAQVAIELLVEADADAPAVEPEVEPVEVEVVADTAEADAALADAQAVLDAYEQGRARPR